MAVFTKCVEHAAGICIRLMNSHRDCFGQLMSSAKGVKITRQVQGLESGKPVILMNAATSSSTMDGYTESWPWPAWQIELMPHTGVCTPE